MHRTNLHTDLQNIGSVHGEANSIFSTVLRFNDNICGGCGKIGVAEKCDK